MPAADRFVPFLFFCLVQQVPHVSIVQAAPAHRLASAALWSSYIRIVLLVLPEYASSFSITFIFYDGLLTVDW